jgi:hypothetical protein
MIDPTFEVPEELKERVAQRLKTSGALKQIARKIKVGMTAAIHELRDHPNAKSSLELQIFGDANEAELAALQTVSQYLEEKGLTYTLGCLIEEAGVQKEDNAYDLLELLADDGDEEEDGSGFNSSAAVVDRKEWPQDAET